MRFAMPRVSYNIDPMMNLHTDIQCLDSAMTSMKGSLVDNPVNTPAKSAIGIAMRCVCHDMSTNATAPGTMCQLRLRVEPGMGPEGP